MRKTLLLPLSLCFLLITNHVCVAWHHEEREALLSFKNCQIGGALLSSVWKSKDCCMWEGVSCSNITGHVTKLTLPRITCDNSTEISFFLGSLSKFSFLQFLNVSWSSISAPILQSFASLKELKYLDMSISSFNGTIPSYMGNLTNLEYLDMSYTSLEVGSLKWLSNLISLQYIDLSFVTNLNESPDWYNYFSKLPNLRVLRLPGFNLTTLPSSFLRNNFSSISTLDLSADQFQDPSSNLKYLLNGSNNLVHLYLSDCVFNDTIPGVFENLSSLVTLDLSHNNFMGTIPDNFRNLINLETLDMSYNFLQGPIPTTIGSLGNLITLDMSFNHLQGPIPAILGSLCNLISLDLSFNEISRDMRGMLGKPTCQTYKLQSLNLSNNGISGDIPDWIGKMINLNHLYMYNNQLNGSLPTSLGQLSNLVELGLGGNSMQGVLSEAHFENMTKLEGLNLNSNKFTLNVNSTWIPPFQLQSIYMASCEVGPKFPYWLRTQRKLSHIDLSSAKICDVIPSWLWNISLGAHYLNISNNCINGTVNVSDIYPSATMIDLSSNLIQGPLPYLNSSVTVLYLYNNSFSGQLQPILNKEMTQLQTIVVSRNSLTGGIPYGICEMRGILILDLSFNKLTGEFPNCTENLGIVILNLASNNFHGSIPRCINGIGDSLGMLKLRNNNFSGKIPTLNNASSLLLLDLGYNEFTGNIPTWNGELSSLRFLSLRSNKLNGSIPSELSHLPLQFLDLGNNELSGTIPPSFAYLSEMKYDDMNYEDYIYFGIIDFLDQGFIFGLPKGYEETLIANMKGKELKYSSTITLVRILDLSDNKLTGIVPTELMNLTGLQTLNLSKNMLTGVIPDKIGTMTQLETLDLSRNHLSGEIPNSLSSLTVLSHLNLSYNNLSGRVPTGMQLQTFMDPSIYFHNNPNLCGFPLPVCYVDVKGNDDDIEYIDDDSDDMFDLYLSMGIGYGVGLWVIIGVIMFVETWRIAYFRFIDDIADKILLMKEIVRKEFHVLPFGKGGLGIPG